MLAPIPYSLHNHPVHTCTISSTLAVEAAALTSQRRLPSLVPSLSLYVFMNSRFFCNKHKHFRTLLGRDSTGVFGLLFWCFVGASLSLVAVYLDPDTYVADNRRDMFRVQAL